MTEKELLQNALNEKLYAAEKRISILRLLLIGFNSLIFLLFMEPTEHVRLAYVIIVIANLYAVISVVFEPYRRLTFLSSIYFTTVTDCALIVLWIMATGFMDSPFYVIWYVSLISVAFRYSLMETAVSTLVYLLLYMLIFALDPHSDVNVSDLLVRLGYIPLAGMLGMYFSIEITDQIDGKIKIIKGEAALKSAHHDLELKVEERTQQLTVINKDLTDSINYAERIQTAILPTTAEIESRFKDAFVLHLPKDIISGDFHWLHQDGNLTHIAVVDCTGHGVPGALMSMIGNNLLNHAVIDKGISDPGEILAEMDTTLAQMLKADSDGHAVNDGMDISLCTIDHHKRVLSYAGAHGHGFLFHEGRMTELEPTKFSIGGLMSGPEKKFDTIKLKFNHDDQLYLFTDGFQDQFGGSTGKKFYRKNLIALLERIGRKPMDEQGRIVRRTFEEWKGAEMQMDDVTVIGLTL